MSPSRWSMSVEPSTIWFSWWVKLVKSLRSISSAMCKGSSTSSRWGRWSRSCSRFIVILRGTVSSSRVFTSCRLASPRLHASMWLVLMPASRRRIRSLVWFILLRSSAFTFCSCSLSFCATWSFTMAVFCRTRLDSWNCFCACWLRLVERSYHSWPTRLWYSRARLGSTVGGLARESGVCKVVRVASAVCSRDTPGPAPAMVDARDACPRPPGLR
mmetsp:Transcript_12956/g.24685  ORF Transcript_12956/g.24685 Transcript_12956/m.24685 type:complete len:215 (-) Transcript_12956:55-699(-)